MARSGSFSTVTVTYLDRAPCGEVILIGSLATGTPVPDSDVDLLLIPYTRDEIERMKRDNNALALGALREGVTVFRR